MMDVMFPDTLAPPWDELVTELKDRYLPADHSLRVELKFDATTQRRWLEEYVERSRRPGNLEEVSPVIKKLTHSMCAQNAFEEEGIFRIAGSRVKMNCLLNAINSGYLDVLDTTNDFDVHCLAGVLKQYIRELPDSLLCNDFYEDWIEAIG